MRETPRVIRSDLLLGACQGLLSEAEFFHIRALALHAPAADVEVNLVLFRVPFFPPSFLPSLLHVQCRDITTQEATVHWANKDLHVRTVEFGADAALFVCKMAI
jgi:hypothetical protein